MTADDLDTLATRLGALAQAVREPLDRVVAYHRPDVWRGARADRFGQELADQRLRVRVAADELAAAARLLRARAELLRAFEQS
jgi:phosphatidylserine/phosphatidylglycerophosphate/cardiolipin synthase-like enzyme